MSWRESARERARIKDRESKGINKCLICGAFLRRASRDKFCAPCILKEPILPFAAYLDAHERMAIMARILCNRRTV